MQELNIAYLLYKLILIQVGGEDKPDKDSET